MLSCYSHQRLLWLLVALTLLTACKPSQKDSSEATLLQTETLHLQISPSTIPVETPLTMSLDSHRELINVRGELRGVSMYMGRIPLQWRQRAVTTADEMALWQAEFFLGACSDPDMLWQLDLWLDFADGQSEMQTVQFKSSWH